jgi:hypothetical protein
MLTANRKRVKLLLLINRRHTKQPKNEVLPGTLTLMALNSITGAAREQFAAEEGNWRQVSEITSRDFVPSACRLVAPPLSIQYEHYEWSKSSKIDSREK